ACDGRDRLSVISGPLRKRERGDHSEAIERDRVVPEKLALLLLRGAGDDAVDDADPLGIANRKLGDGPVAAEHHAVEAEALDRMGDVGRELLLGPIVE